MELQVYSLKLHISTRFVEAEQHGQLTRPCARYLQYKVLTN